MRLLSELIYIKKSRLDILFIHKVYVKRIWVDVEYLRKLRRKLKYKTTDKTINNNLLYINIIFPNLYLYSRK